MKEQECPSKSRTVGYTVVRIAQKIEVCDLSTACVDKQELDATWDGFFHEVTYLHQHMLHALFIVL